MHTREKLKTKHLKLKTISSPPALNAAGNLTRDKDGYEYEYDYENRIVKITKDSSDIAEFAYDALGHRIQLTGADMKRNRLVRTFALVGLVLSLVIGWQQQSAIAQSAGNTAESPSKANQAPEPPKVSPKLSPDAKNLSPRISFEKTVCDLGDVGQGTKNTCEFKFTNTGSADGGLKIGKIKRTCGCTVFELDRKEYAPGRTGTIRVSYIAGKEKHWLVRTIRLLLIGLNVFILLVNHVLAFPR